MWFQRIRKALRDLEETLIWTATLSEKEIKQLDDVCNCNPLVCDCENCLKIK